MAPSDPNLEVRILALPQELQDAIIEFTLIATLPGKSTPITIDRGYRPPWQISFNRVTLDSVAKVYYSTRAFTLPELQFEYIAVTLQGWTASMPIEHVRHISTIHCSLASLMMVVMGYLELEDQFKVLRHYFTTLKECVGPDEFEFGEGVLSTIVTVEQWQAYNRRDVLMSEKDIEKLSRRHAGG